jgi:hypothetical protein
MPGQCESFASSLDGDELGAYRAVLHVKRQRSAQTERVRSGGCEDAVRCWLDPRHDRSVVRAQRQLHPHRHPTLQTLHDPHQPGRTRTPPRHEVDHPNRAVRGLEIGLEDERPGPVTTRAQAHLARRPEQPPAMALIAHQCREARRRVKPRQTQPVDRPVATDQRSSSHVTDQAIVLDTQWVPLSSLIATPTVGAAPGRALSQPDERRASDAPSFLSPSYGRRPPSIRTQTATSTESSRSVPFRRRHARRPDTTSVHLVQRNRVTPPHRGETRTRAAMKGSPAHPTGRWSRSSPHTRASGCSQIPS